MMFNGKKVFVITLLMLSLLFCSGCDSQNYASVEEIQQKNGEWEVKNQLLGIDYTVNEGGVLLTNNGNTALVEVTAKFYDKDRNYLDEETKSLVLKASESWFVFFERLEDVEDVEYSIVTAETDREVPLATDIKLDYDEGKVVVSNLTEKNIEDFAFQYVYYNASGDILFVENGTIHDGEIPASEKVAEEFSTEYPDGLEKYDTVDVLIYCLFEKE